MLYIVCVKYSFCNAFYVVYFTSLHFFEAHFVILGYNKLWLGLTCFYQAFTLTYVFVCNQTTSNIHCVFILYTPLGFYLFCVIVSGISLYSGLLD